MIETFNDTHISSMILCINVGRGILDAPFIEDNRLWVEENSLKELPKRKHPRLKGFDYNQNCGYFITFCVKDKQELLGQVVRFEIHNSPHVELTEYGINLCDAIDFMDRNTTSVAIDKYTVMPNHVHILVIVHGASGKPRPTNAVIPKLVSSIKRYTNKIAGFNMWQTSFHDHIIRDDAEYLRIWQYIEDNPANWDDDSYHN